MARPDAVDDAARTALVRARDIWGICAVAGLVSAGLAALPLLARMPWLPGFAYWLIPAGIGLYYMRLGRARTGESETGAAP